MSDFDREFLLLDAVQEFRAQALPYVHPAGTGAVRATVRRRRQARIVTLAVLVAVLVLAPVAAFAAIGGGGAGPRPAGTPTGTPTGSPSPAGTASPSATPSTAPPAPDTPTDLANATFSVGNWRPPAAGDPSTCPSGKVTFSKGDSAARAGSYQLHIQKAVAVDVDNDGSTETAVIVACRDSQAGDYQAVVVKAGPGGSLATLGQVLHTDQNVGDILDAAAGTGGTLSLTVGDNVPCCGTPRAVELTQVRGYSWSGSAFTQVDGRTTFAANRSLVDLRVTAPAVRFGASSGGKSSGTLTVTIHNNGPQPAREVSVLVVFSNGYALERAGGGLACSDPSGGAEIAHVCQVGTVAAGGTATLTLTLTGDGAIPAGINLVPRLGDQKYDLVVVASSQG